MLFRSRVTHPCATLIAPEGTFSFDLHVLSTPPAFVLSQDQTLMFFPITLLFIRYSCESTDFLLLFSFQRPISHDNLVRFQTNQNLYQIHLRFVNMFLFGTLLFLTIQDLTFFILLVLLTGKTKASTNQTKMN